MEEEQDVQEELKAKVAKQQAEDAYVTQSMASDAFGTAPAVFMGDDSKNELPDTSEFEQQRESAVQEASFQFDTFQNSFTNEDVPEDISDQPPSPSPNVGAVDGQPAVQPLVSGPQVVPVGFDAAAVKPVVKSKSPAKAPPPPPKQAPQKPGEPPKPPQSIPHMPVSSQSPWTRTAVVAADTIEPENDAVSTHTSVARAAETLGEDMEKSAEQLIATMEMVTNALLSLTERMANIEQIIERSIGT